MPKSINILQKVHLWTTALLLLVSGLPELQAQESQYEVVSQLDIVPAWPGHPVGFQLLTHQDKQFVAFYDQQRRMTVAARQLGKQKWQFVHLPENIVWDSHNYIAMTIDNEGLIHLSGNMHCVPLVYFRTKKPLDITTFERIPKMTGIHEKRCTYPHFFRGPQDELIFTYRDGKSGNGNQIYNVYNPQNRTWQPLLNTPLTDGQGKMNAYLYGPLLGPDGFYHLCWVWREHPDCATNHDLSYASSKDLIHWQNSRGEPVQLPMTLETAEIVDPVPSGGGIINGNNKIGFDSQDRVIITYHKNDSNGYTQIYNARLEQGKWRIYQLTNWQYRWNFQGGGSIPFEIRVKPVRLSHGQLTQGYYHKKYGSGTWILDEKTLKPIGKLNTPPPYPSDLSKVRSHIPGMQVNLRSDTGKSPESGMHYLIRWETLGPNRDLPRKGPIPEPTMLQLFKMKKK